MYIYRFLDMYFTNEMRKYTEEFVCMQVELKKKNTNE